MTPPVVTPSTEKPVYVTTAMRMPETRFELSGGYVANVEIGGITAADECGDINRLNTTDCVIPRN